MTVLFESDSVAVAVKEPGIPSEKTPTENGAGELLSEQLGTEIYLLHRLDRDVGGVMVFAKTKSAAAALSAQIAQRQFIKEYLAVADGLFEEKSGEMHDLLFKDSKQKRSFTVKRMRKGVKEASLSYNVLSEDSGKSLVYVTLHTGRTHQIRVQFASRGKPLCGDKKYGSRDSSSKIALFAFRVTFTEPVSGEKLTFSALPEKDIYPWQKFNLNSI